MQELDYIDVIGLVGVTLILIAYFGSQVEWWQSNSYEYLLANAVGAVLVMISLCFNWNLSSFVIECFWLLISVYGIVKRYMYDRHKVKGA